MPRGAYAPRSCVGVRMSAGEIAIFAMHKCMCTRAAGVSPPWFGKRTCQYASAKSRESVNGAMTNSGAVAVANPRGAYAPRSCVGVRMSAGEIAIFAMHKRTSRQERQVGARRGSETAPAMAIRFRRVITFTTRHPMVAHGWLTPAAPGAALGGRMRMVANVRLRFVRAIRFTATAGSRQPLPVDACESLQMCGSVLHGRFVPQPRPAYASRSWCRIGGHARMVADVR
jgi:hypothetical protein